MSNLSVFHANLCAAADEYNIPLLNVLKEVKRNGISAVDVDDAALNCDVLSILSKAEMTVNTIYAFIDFSKPEAICEGKRVIQTAARLRAGVMFVPKLLPMEEIAPLKKCETEAEIFRWLDGNETALKTADALQMLAENGKANGVFVCVENFDSCCSLTERIGEIAWLFEKAPSLNYNLDTGNFAVSSEEVSALFERFHAKIVNVHCKDRKRTNEGYQVSVVGDGEMPISSVVSSLRQAQYSGRFSIEVFGVKEALSAVLRSARFLSQI